MQRDVYNLSGKSVKKVDLPIEIFGQKWNADLVHQVATSMLSNRRASLAKVKGRGEVRGGGKKPWQQKGTGRARHGSIRSPLWIGGGTTHGPTTEKSYKKAINAKMKNKAFITALSKKLHDEEILFVDKAEFSGKTKEAAGALKNLSKIKGFENMARKKTYFVLPTREVGAWRGLKNLRNVSFDQIKDVNLLKLLSNKFLVFFDDKATVDFLTNKV